MLFSFQGALLQTKSSLGLWAQPLVVALGASLKPIFQFLTKFIGSETALESLLDQSNWGCVENHCRSVLLI